MKGICKGTIAEMQIISGRSNKSTIAEMRIISGRSNKSTIAELWIISGRSNSQKSSYKKWMILWCVILKGIKNFTGKVLYKIVWLKLWKRHRLASLELFYYQEILSYRG